MDYQIISTTEQLKQICQQAVDVATQMATPAIMLDTEFVRTRTYHPQLGLIQLYDGQNLSLIDPLTIDDMSAFADLLSNSNILKVLHACGEDLEVFQHHFKTVPTPMVDTQLMAAFLGYGLSTGFARLVSDFLEVELDKSESRADWLARPLTDKQLDYAAADVHYLLPLFDLLKQKLEQKTQADTENVLKTDWWQAAQQESTYMAKKRLRPINIEKAYKKVKGAWLLNSEQLAILNVLTQWRLNEALQCDLALNFVIKEANMLEVARQKMSNTQSMINAGFDHREVNRHGKTLVKLVQQGLEVAEEDRPAKIKRTMDDPRYKMAFKQLKEAMAQVVEQTGFASEFLASKKQLNQLLHWAWRMNKNPAKLPDVMQGWRKPLVGDVLEPLLIEEKKLIEENE